jgi:hypothetical protein
MVTVNKSRNMRWVEHAKCITEIRNTDKYIHGIVQITTTNKAASVTWHGRQETLSWRLQQ